MGAAPCATTFCDRAFLQCSTTGPDNDADGHYDATCDPGFGPGATRGDDCDDSDPAAFGGRPEVCDAIGHDEDCDSTTVSGLADGDVDGDGSFAVTCCNRDVPTGETLCGADCDDLDGTVNPSAPDGPDIACDGIDNDCDLEVDEGCGCRDGQTRRCGTDLGECLPGTETCVSGAWGMCIGGVGATPEECDGDDDDCNMVVDDGCSCVDGASRSCGLDEGACAAGVQRCELGTWSSICEGAIGPTIEACDNDDDDCDGTIDNGCDCRDGDTRPCGSDVGACVTGTERCMGGRWGACMGAVGPSAEDCDGGDEDCNGIDDNGCGCREGDTVSCGSDVGACVAGTIRCVGGAWTACTGGEGPSMEVCDGAQDENCDGIVDEGCSCVAGASRPCGMGMIFGGSSRCVRGSETCSGGTWGACMGAIEPIAEQCGNPIDDDCDGSLNNGCGIAQLDAGFTHTCAVRQNGDLFCWGQNDYGQLGDGTVSMYRLAPFRVPGLPEIAEVSVGVHHTCARARSGSVYCWGSNELGTVGDGTTTSPRMTPVLISGVSDAAQVDCGGYHTCVRRSSGAVSCWGSNERGAIGDGTTMTPRVVPTTVPGLTAVSVTAGGLHTCAILGDTSVACWGDNSVGQLGIGSADESAHTNPAPVVGLTGIVQISGGSVHTCARRVTGGVTCWGSRQYGQVGDGTTGTSPRLTPVTVTTIVDAGWVSAGDFHTCVRRVGGGLMCWGLNTNGQVGSGAVASPVAAAVAVMGVSDATSVAAGGFHGCASRSGGGVSCWGGNSVGQLGDGTVTSPRLLPVAAVGLPW